MGHRESLEQIFDKPGRCWTPDERRQVKAWLSKNEQLRSLVFWGLRHLGDVATVQDAEDAWHEYYMRKLDVHIDTYDPAKGRRFWGFVYHGFWFFCRDVSKKLRARAQREIPLPVVEDDEGRMVELEFMDESEDCDPEKNVIRRQFLSDLQRRFLPAFER